MTVITGAIKLLEAPEDACLTNVRDLLKSLEKLLAVEFDADKITNVVVSSDEPEQTEKDIIWFRLNTAGNFIGIHVFVQGEWIQMFPTIGEVIKVRGDSRVIAPGYALVSTDLVGFTPEMVAKLQEEWFAAPEGHYLIYHVVYQGL